MTAHDGLPVASDSVFQGQLRRLQSTWREERGLPIGTHRGRPLGSRLALPRPIAELRADDLANYLTPTIQDLVHREVIGSRGQHDKLYGVPRIFDDLLSSQPLCFNLFGELAADTRAATEVAKLLWPTRVLQVTSIQFEHSPGRGDERYLGTRSAFDVYIEHTTPAGGLGFIGIEVKYHENLRGQPATIRQRARQVADASGIFPDDRSELERLPLQQIWLDHLLALAMLQAGEYKSGLFVFLYPAGNAPCAAASDRYRSLLTNTSTFERLTLESVVAAIRWATRADWIEAVNHRYFNVSRLMET